METVTVSNTIPCGADEFFHHLQQTKNLRFIARPIVTYDFDAKRYPVWQTGMRVNIKPQLHIGKRTILLGDHMVHVVMVNDVARTIKTAEYGGFIRQWNHTMQVDDIDESTCRYTDTITIEAGFRTMLVTKFAQLFYRHRHQSWRTLINERLIAA